MPKLTKRYVESLVPHAQKVSILWDSEIKGLCVVVRPSGRKTYCIQYRNKQRLLKRLKIGIHGQIATEEARSLAKRHLGHISHGGDPLTEKKSLTQNPSFEELAQDYLSRHAQHKRPKSIQEDKRLLKCIIPSWAQKKISLITRRDVEAVHLKMEKTPYQANRLLALLSKMFELSMAWGLRTDNPVKGVVRFVEEKKDRWLDEKELESFWSVLESYPNHLTTYAFKLLLLTGARKGELLNATWDQIDLTEGVWTKPSHITKQKKTEHLPLSSEALEVLHQLRQFTGEQTTYLFPGRISGKPLQEIKTFWKRVLREAGLENVRIHDLRHTHASHLVSSGLSLSIVGKLLGHTQAATTQRYAHLSHQSLRQATSVFGAKVTEIRQKNSSV